MPIAFRLATLTAPIFELFRCSSTSQNCENSRRRRRRRSALRRAHDEYGIQWPFGRAEYAHSHYASIMADVQITHSKLHRICHDKVTRSGSRHQPTTKHNLQYRTVRVRLSTWQSARAIAVLYEYSYDCFFVRFRFTQCNKKYGTREDSCLQATSTTPCDRQPNEHTTEVREIGRMYR